MSDVKIKTFLPLCSMPPSDDEANKSPVHAKEKLAAHASRICSGGVTISPVPMRKNIKTAFGPLLPPALGRMTPTGQGRIKAPPVCVDTALKKVATSIEELRGVCFSQEEADSCAERALALDGNVGDCLERIPLNVANCDFGFPRKSDAESSRISLSEGKPFVSSNSTVVTTSSASSCGRSVVGSETVAPSKAKKHPPLEVVSTESAVNNSEDEHSGAASLAQLKPVSEKRASSTTSLSATFTDNLVKENSSRQGRSLQRWLVHSPTEELVRQVAGTIPITQDGRIILASASRKTEWILPKGGWDEDETREECAARETFEEAGLLGRLGGCLEPIDYETKKARKRRLGNMQGSGAEGNAEKLERGEVTTGKREGERLCPALPKRVKTDKPVVSEPTSSKPASFANGCGSNCDNKPAAHPPPMLATAKSLDPKNHSYVRLFLFPLYVSSVKSDWPENGRLRRLVDIDEAIEIMEVENRPYFKTGLEMVKERGLHLVKP